MGLFSNRVDKESLKRGDHIYTWSKCGTYAHHGIYVGNNTVIHYSKKGDAVVSFSLDSFLDGGKLYRYEYGVSHVLFIAKGIFMSGPCTLAVSDPDDEVVHRAEYLLENGLGCYDLFKNNREDFAVYCKTGLVFPDQGKGFWQRVLDWCFNKFVASACSIFTGILAFTEAVLAGVGLVFAKAGIVLTSAALAGGGLAFTKAAMAVAGVACTKVAISIASAGVVPTAILFFAVAFLAAYSARRYATDISHRNAVKVSVKDLKNW